MTWLLKIFSFVLGYAIGNINGRHLMVSLGKKENLGYIIDIIKTALTILFIRWATTLSLQNVGVMVAAVGLVVGHIFPYWTDQRDKNAIVVIITAWVCGFFTWGISGILIGIFVVFITRYLVIGQAVVPLFCLIATFFTEPREVWVLALVLCIFAFVGLWPSLMQIRKGQYPKIDWDLRRK